MLKINSFLVDTKVRGLNVSATTTLAHYWNIVKSIYESNEYQRRRERTKWNVYKLLKQDIAKGCLMPPITLATTEEFLTLDQNLTDTLWSTIEGNAVSNEKFLQKALSLAIENDQLIILDGLQRTYTIKDALAEASKETLAYIQKRPIRIEIYLGLTKYGLLYRMLTLNTGQTPMSLRHQLEILFSDYIDEKKMKGIKIYTEANQKSYRPKVGHFKYSDIVDMYQSFILKSPQSFDRKMLLEEIKKLEFLEGFKREKDPVMKNLLTSYNLLIDKLSKAAIDWNYKGNVPKPFGSTIPDFFLKPQPMSGYGCACRTMLQEGRFSTLTDINKGIRKHFNPDQSSLEDGLDKLIIFIAEIQDRSRRYGTDQRQFLATFFEFLLREKLETVDFSRTVVNAYDRF